jgi:cardiolipin synthase A/B
MPRAKEKATGPRAKPRRWLIGDRKWPIVVIICVAVVAILLFLAQDPRTLYVRSALAASDPGFPDYIATLIDAPVTSGDSYEVLQNGDQFYASMLAAIRGAKRTIALETYNFNKGDIGETFTVALVDAATRGVEVRLVLDAFGASAPPDGLDDRIEKAGGRVHWFNQIGPWTVESTNTRTHRKLLVVDGEVAYTGGAGIADTWVGNARNKDEWRDTQFKITGPAVRLLEACFFENWLEAGGEGEPVLHPQAATASRDTRSVVIWSNPVGGVSNVKQLYLYSIAAARESIDIQSPYFVPDASGRAALKEARKRGVKVRILSDGDETDAKSVKHASRRTYQRLLDDGIEVYEYVPTMMHAKVMVVDRAWTVVGSGNFDNRSLELNDEITVAVFDRGLSRTLTDAFENDMRHSKQWTITTWPKRPWHWKARELFWGIFGEVF